MTPLTHISFRSVQFECRSRIREGVKKKNKDFHWVRIYRVFETSLTRLCKTILNICDLKFPHLIIRKRITLKYRQRHLIFVRKRFLDPTIIIQNVRRILST